MSTPITGLIVKPGYARGFEFSWAVSGGFEEPGPWRFTVEESAGVMDNFVPISSVLVNVFAWADELTRIPSKSTVLYYRVHMRTPQHEYYSDVVGPIGTVERRDYLIIKDVMRREVLHARTLAGIKADLWVKNIYGPKCTVCIDPISGTIRNSKCPVCYGTGYVPPYHGPYTMWFTFSPTDNKLEQVEDGSGTYEERQNEVRVVGTMVIRKGDVLVDPEDDKRFMVLGSQNLAEVRRIPVVQQVMVSEMPTTDVIYQLTGGVTAR